MVILKECFRKPPGFFISFSTPRIGRGDRASEQAWISMVPRRVFTVVKKRETGTVCRKLTGFWESDMIGIPKTGSRALDSIVPGLLSNVYIIYMARKFSAVQDQNAKKR